MRYLQIDWQQRQVHAFGHRIHHYLTGFGCMLAGAWMVWDDRRDIAATLKYLRARTQSGPPKRPAIHRVYVKRVTG